METLEEPKEPAPLTEFEQKLADFNGGGWMPMRWQMYYLRLRQYWIELDKQL